MDKFVYIHTLIRYGFGIAVIAAIAVLAFGVAVLFHVTATVFWAIFCLFVAAIVFCGVMLLRDIARVIAETLIPMP